MQTPLPSALGMVIIDGTHLARPPSSQFPVSNAPVHWSSRHKDPGSALSASTLASGSPPLVPRGPIRL